VGTEALLDLTTGMENTALGFRALTDNTQGNLNTAVGSAALKQNRIGNRNTATGFHALAANRFGNNNTANGYFAFVGGSGNSNTAVGAFALQRSTGDNNIALGFAAGANLTTGNQNIDIGNRGVAGESGTIRIGDSDQTRTFIAGISGQAVSGSPVYVNAGGQLGVLPSSERFKEDIKPMDNASEVILNVEPVTFRYKKEIDPDAVAQFGLVAEKLARVNPDLVERDREGKPFTVRYDAVNTMLLNEFLKEHRRVRDLECALDQLTTRLKEQDVKVQKMSEQLTAAGVGAERIVISQ
jgi:trimeric autotransporter adhesin